MSAAPLGKINHFSEKTWANHLFRKMFSKIPCKNRLIFERLFWGFFRCDQNVNKFLMCSWWAFCIQKEGLEFGQKMKGIFGLILYEPSWARKRRLYYLWLLSGASKPSQGFSPFLEGKSIFFRKKEKALPEPSCSRVFVLRSNIIWGPGFWNLAFFYENPGLGHAWFSTIYSKCVHV